MVAHWKKSIKYYVLSIMGFLCIIHATNYLLPIAYAQTAPQLSTSTNAASPYTTYNIPNTISPTSPLYTDLLINNIFHTFSCLGVGQSVIGQPCLSYQKGIPVLSQVNSSGGALGAVSSIISMLYLNPPIGTGDYLASIGQGLGIVKEAHAQVVGSGANVLSPILSLWQVSRNISYLAMIIIFLIIGLMVMFRQKINPQTVITAQAAIPGLVLGLILITFSYFLASLITDTSFLGINLVGYYFSSAQPHTAVAGAPKGDPKLIQDIANDNVGTIFSKFVGMISSGDISNLINTILNSVDGGVKALIKAFAGLIGYQAGSSAGGGLGSVAGVILCPDPTRATTGGLVGLLTPLCAVLAGTLGGAVVGGLAAGITAMWPGETFGLVLYFVAVAIMIYTMIKLLFRLINNYLTIIFLTISAPFHFLAASLPGRQGLVTNWILNMLCNALAFPAVFVVLYFVAYLWGYKDGSPTAPGQFFNISAQLNVTGNQTLPLLGGLSLSFIRVLLAYGALLATPTIPDLVCKTIGRVSQAGQMLGQEISASTRGGQGYANQLGGRLGGAGSSLKKTAFGEMQYHYDSGTRKWEPYIGTPGVKQILKP